MKIIVCLAALWFTVIACAEIPNCSDGSYTKVYIVRLENPSHEAFAAFYNMRTLRMINVQGISYVEYYLQGAFSSHQHILAELGPLVSRYNAQVRCQSELEYRRMFR